MFGAEEIGVETAEMAFLSETQYMKDFLNSIDVYCCSKGPCFSCLEQVLQSEVTFYVMTMFLQQVSRTQRLGM